MTPRTSRHQATGSRGKHGLAILTWLGVYPLLTAIVFAVEPILAGASLPLRSLAMSLIMVPAMVYGVMPVVMRVMARIEGRRT